MTRCPGTVRWSAPEVLISETYSEFADVYSLGIVLWEMYACKIPFLGISDFEVFNQIKAGRRPSPIPKNCPNSIAKLMNQVWNQSASKRPQFTKVIEELEKSLLEVSDSIQKGVRDS